MLTVKALRAGYADVADILYVTSSEDADLSSCYRLEDTPSGITVNYDDSGRVLGAEISDFSSSYKVPVKIVVDAETPFILDIDSSAFVSE